MDLFDFFFPEQAQATHLRNIANRRPVPQYSRTDNDQDSQIAAMREDVHFLTMVVTALLKRLSETETMSLGDMRDLLDEIDALDGQSNGGLSPSVLRGLLGVLVEPTEASPEPENDIYKIVTTPRYRTR